MKGFRNRLFKALFGFYRLFIFPFLITLSGGSSCIFRISCSRFSQNCFERYGFVKALWLTLRRLSRCRAGFRVGARNYT